MKIIVTGAAGFIGFHLCKRLLLEGHEVVGIDEMNDYYDVNLKRDRAARLACPKFTLLVRHIEDIEGMEMLFSQFRPDVVVNLAAQAGVRHSIDQPMAFARSNLVGSSVVLEQCHKANVKHLLIASSSSVYGSTLRLPFEETDTCVRPLSFYAATKRANELMAHSYSVVHKLPITCMRFSTVYGPWGRPDMAMIRFIRAMLQDKPVELYGYGDMTRDFTYVDDTVEGIMRLIPAIPNKNALCQIYNISAGNPVWLPGVIAELEHNLGIKAEIELRPAPPTDIRVTYSSNDKLYRTTGFAPATTISTGIKALVDWAREYYREAN